MAHGSQWIRLDASGKAVDGPCLLLSLSGSRSSTAGSVAKIYDARHAQAARQITELKALANETPELAWSKGLRCEFGVYVEVQSGGQEVLVEYLPLSELA